MTDTTFQTLLSTPYSPRLRALVLDSQAYAQAVLRQGREVPWSSPQEVANHYGQAQSLLHSDAVVLDLRSPMQAYLDEHPAIVDAMGARSRIGYALRTMLSNEDLAERLLELVSVIGQTVGTPVLVQLPSPRVWLAWAHELAGVGDIAEITPEDIDDYTPYIANWIQGLPAEAVSGVILDERWPQANGPARVDPGVYTPIANVAGHQRWALLIRDAEQLYHLDGEHADVVPASLWHEDAVDLPAVGGAFWFAEIPASAVPETVLARLTLF